MAVPSLAPRRVAVACLAMVLAACGGGDGGSGAPAITTPPVEQVGSVSVSLPATTLQVGATLTAAASVQSTSGAALNRAVTWSVSDASLASITPAGVITGVAPGTVTVTATSEGRSGSASLAVVQVPVAVILLSAASPSLTVGQTVAVNAVLRAADGTTLTGRTIEWSTTTPTVASVSQAGVVTGLSTGSATISARSGAAEGRIVLLVTPVPVASIIVTTPVSSIEAGRTVQLSATLRAADGSVLNGRTVDWESSNSVVATVSPAGVVTGVSPGPVTISARSGGAVGTVALSVTPVPVASVSVSSPQSTLTTGSTTQLIATLRAADGAELTGRTVQWSSSVPSVASVNGSGLVTALTPGTTTISATSEGRTGALVITVQAPAPASVVVTPGTLALSVGGTTTLVASVRDAVGNTLPGERVTWATSNAAVAGVTQGGVLTAIGVGTATISASAGGRTGTAIITVQNAPVASVTLNLTGINMLVGDVRVLAATARDAAGNPLAGRQVTWTSSNTSIVNGQVFGDTAIITGVSPGSATITATVEGRTASAVVLVNTGGTVNVCTLIAGALLFGSDDQYLGRFTNRFDSQSVLNEFGIYGNRFSSTSTNNEFGRYGSRFDNLSAWNPFASRPPVIVRNGQFIAYYSVNTSLTPRVAPAVALSCNFP